MTDAERRKHAAYWFAVGVVEEQVRIWRDDSIAISTASPVDLSQEFAEYAEREAVDYYDPSHPRFSLPSIPDQWKAFCADLKANV